jgi:hypothetical protein
MKHFASLLILLFAGDAGLRLQAEERPDLVRLRVAYEKKLDDTKKTLTESYLKDLEKLRDGYINARNSSLAKEVEIEIESVKRRDLATREDVVPATPPNASTAKVFVGAATPPDPKWFVGKSWLTEAGLKWNFGDDGLSGDKMKGGRKVASFTWKLPESGVIELTERDAAGKPIGITYVRFVNSSEAWAGGSAGKLDTRLRAEGK